MQNRVEQIETKQSKESLATLDFEKNKKQVNSASRVSSTPDNTFKNAKNMSQKYNFDYIDQTMVRNNPNIQDFQYSPTLKLPKEIALKEGNNNQKEIYNSFQKKQQKQNKDFVLGKNNSLNDTIGKKDSFITNDILETGAVENDKSILIKINQKLVESSNNQKSLVDSNYKNIYDPHRLNIEKLKDQAIQRKLIREKVQNDQDREYLQYKILKQATEGVNHDMLPEIHRVSVISSKNKMNPIIQDIKVQTIKTQSQGKETSKYLTSMTHERRGSSLIRSIQLAEQKRNNQIQDTLSTQMQRVSQQISQYISDSKTRKQKQNKSQMNKNLRQNGEIKQQQILKNIETLENQLLKIQNDQLTLKSEKEESVLVKKQQINLHFDKKIDDYSSYLQSANIENRFDHENFSNDFDNYLNDKKIKLNTQTNITTEMNTQKKLIESVQVKSQKSKNQDNLLKNILKNENHLIVQQEKKRLYQSVIVEQDKIENFEKKTDQELYLEKLKLFQKIRNPNQLVGIDLNEAIILKAPV